LVDQLGFSLCLVTDRSQGSAPLEEAVESCLQAGLRAVQLREKDMAVRELLGLAERLRESTRRHGARLLVNDRSDVALAVGAEGVQRTGTSLPVATLRSICPSGFLIGASVHSLAEAPQRRTGRTSSSSALSTTRRLSDSMAHHRGWPPSSASPPRWGCPCSR